MTTTETTEGGVFVLTHDTSTPSVATEKNVTKLTEVIKEDKCCVITAERRQGRSKLIRNLARSLHEEYKIAIVVTGHRAAAVITRDGEDVNVWIAGQDIPNDYTLLFIDNADFVYKDTLMTMCEGRQWVMTCLEPPEDIDSYMTFSSGHATKSKD